MTALASRVTRLEQACRGNKIRVLIMEEDDPDLEEKIRQVEQEAKIAGDFLAVWDKDDDQL